MVQMMGWYVPIPQHSVIHVFSVCKRPCFVITMYSVFASHFVFNFVVSSLHNDIFSLLPMLLLLDD